VARYVLEQRIGDGGMAEVFRARVEGPAGFVRACAVKRLLPELRREANNQARFIDEARISARLHHPCIVDVVDFYEDAGVHHLVMELVDGVSAEDLVNAGLAGQFVPVSVVTAIALGTARALQYAHSHGVLHRDVSACNVLLSVAGDVKLADFGLADAVGRLSSTEPGSVAGKIAYMSPSRRQGVPATAADDAYALGVLVDRLATAADPRDRATPSGQKLLRAGRMLVGSAGTPDWDGVVESLRRLGPAGPEEIGRHVGQVAPTERRHALRV
jgi:serine/threonine-protein kinase